MKLTTVFLAVSVVLVFVWERVDVVRVGYQVERLKTQKTLLERERDELQVKLSALSSPERIAKVATEKLGMVPPERGQVILVQRESVAPSQVQPVDHEMRLAKNIVGKRQ